MRTPKFNPRQIGKFVVYSVIALIVFYVAIMLIIGQPKAPTVG